LDGRGNTMITGIDLALKIVMPLMRDVIDGLSKEEQGRLDKYTTILATAMDKLDPAIRAAVAVDLQEQMDSVAQDEERATYMEQVRKQREELRKQEQENTP